MIRRDFILRMIEEMGRALAQIRALRKGGKEEEAATMVDAECVKLTTLGVTGILGLSETELLARVLEGQYAQTVHLRTLAVVTFLREAADIATAQGREEKARPIYLKALHLLLGVLSQDDPMGFPEFVPGIESILTALQDQPLPMETLGMLMRHYEGTGQYGKAEDALYGILEVAGDEAEVVSFGQAFYQRLLRKSDSTLMSGNLSRTEAEEGFKELTPAFRKRKLG